MSTLLYNTYSVKWSTKKGGGQNSDKNGYVSLWMTPNTADCKKLKSTQLVI